MRDRLTRRTLIKAGLSTVAGVSGLAAAARLADRYGLIPPDHYGLFGAGETLTYSAQRILTSGHSLAREFARSEISKVAPVNGEPPEDDAYQRLLAGRFAEWRLVVDGLVATPSSFSLPDLQAFPSSSQITMHACEEGWSFIAEWTGVRLSHVLNRIGVSPRAKYVMYFSFDHWFDSLDMADAWHPQTLLAYGMNGKEIPTGHGAPVRMRVERQLGYKNMKYLSRLTVVDSVKTFGRGLGSGAPEEGYSWYAGI